MNTKTKKRMVAVTGVIVIVLILVLAFVGGASAAKNATVAEAAEGNLQDVKVKVSGNVVANSFDIDGNSLTFSIYDADADPNAQTQLKVAYDGGVSATFGNDVVAICTGKIDAQGVLQCTELVTKCPSKYENATEALTIDKLKSYGEDVYDKPVKVVGVVSGAPASVGESPRFVVTDADSGTIMPVEVDGGLSDDIADGSSVVLTGSLGAQGSFNATEVALEG